MVKTWPLSGGYRGVPHKPCNDQNCRDEAVEAEHPATWSGTIDGTIRRIATGHGRYYHCGNEIQSSASARSHVGATLGFADIKRRCFIQNIDPFLGPPTTLPARYAKYLALVIMMRPAPDLQGAGYALDRTATRSRNPVNRRRRFNQAPRDDGQTNATKCNSRVV